MISARLERPTRNDSLGKAVRRCVDIPSAQHEYSDPARSYRESDRTPVVSVPEPQWSAESDKDALASIDFVVVDVPGSDSCPVRVVVLASISGPTISDLTMSGVVVAFGA